MEAIKQIEIVNDLLLINEDQFAIYHTELNQSRFDLKLKTLYSFLMSQKKSFIEDLEAEIGKVDDDTFDFTPGIIYINWVSFRTLANSMRRGWRVSACECNELAAKRAYHQAIAYNITDLDLLHSLKQQFDQLKKNFNEINKVRI